MSRKRKLHTDQTQPVSPTPEDLLESDDEALESDPNETQIQENESKDSEISPESQSPKEAYAFPTKSRCPRCGALDTKATSTQGKIQHRQCQRAICRRRYTVKGEII